jgi:hypothetical protein
MHISTVLGAKTREDKTGQDMARQDKTNQHKTRRQDNSDAS